MKADRKADRGRAERRRAGADSPPRPVRKRRDKRTIYIVCAVLAAVFIISVAVVLRGVSDKRVYNNYMQQAQQSYSQNDFDSALAALRKAAAVDETDECLMLMADCYETQENYTKALEILRTMNVQNPTVSSRIAAIEKRRQTLSEAKAHYEADSESVAVIYSGSEPIGLVDMDTLRGAHAGYGWISLLYLNSDFRSKGYGIQLLGRAIGKYGRLGRNALRLLVSEDNGAAIGFYKKYGFRRLSAQPGTNAELLLMERRLGGVNHGNV